MEPLEKVFYKRLERIREELDEYVTSRFSDNLFTSPIMSNFMHIMRIDEGQEEEDFDNKNKKLSLKKIAPVREKNETYTDLDIVLGNKQESFSEMLLRIIDEKGFRDTEVYKWANIDRRLFSKIRSDKDYVPSKKTVISFCLALQLELNQAKTLLERAGYALSTSSRFDLIIMYLIENKEYSIHFANIVLEDYGETRLSK